MSRFFLFVRFENLFYAYFSAYYQQICRSGQMHFIRGSQNISINLIFMHIMQFLCMLCGKQPAQFKARRARRSDANNPAGCSCRIERWRHGVHLRAGTRCASPAYRTENCRTDIFISAAIRYSDIVRFTQKYSHPDHWACHFRISPSPRLFSS